MQKYVVMLLTTVLVPAFLFSQEMTKPQVEKRVEIIKEKPEGAQCHGMKAPMPKGMSRRELRFQHRACLAEQLKLTDEQKANLEKMRLKYRRERIPLQANLKLAQLDLQEGIKALDQKKIDEAVKKINDFKGQLFQKRINEKVEFLKLLTPEQKKMLDEKKCNKPGMGGMGLEMPGFVPEFGLGNLPEKIQDLVPTLGLLDFDFDFPMLDEEDVEVEIEPND